MKNAELKTKHSRNNCFSFINTTNDLTKDTSQVSTAKIQKRGTKNHKLCYFAFTVLTVTIITASSAVFSGCSSQKTESSSPTVSSEVESESAPAVVNKTESAITSQGSSQESNEYALPANTNASSASSSKTAAQSAAPSGSSQESTLQTASQSDSRSVFQSIFGSDSNAESSNEEKDTSGPKISLAEYNKIKDGMSYADAKSIIGSDGKLQWESGTKGSSMYTVVYRWAGSGNSGTYADLTFENGKLNWEMQFGLE